MHVASVGLVNRNLNINSTDVCWLSLVLFFITSDITLKGFRLSFVFSETNKQ